MKAEQERLEIEIANTRTRHRSEFERRIKQARFASVSLTLIERLSCGMLINSRGVKAYIGD
jgi:hypothetical protein